MVIATVGIALAMTLLGAADPAPRAEADRAVRAALEAGHYPWYDAREGSDSVAPVLPTEWSLPWLERWLNSSGSRPSAGPAGGIGALRLGELFVIGLVVLAIAFLLVILAELWRRYRPTAEEGLAASAATAGATGRVEGLPAGVRPQTDDPWAEAIACRDRGDHARAIICLFAHQLLTLDRLRLVRLAPGRTGRQLVRAVDDRPLRRCVEPTLRLFEMVSYGHRLPPADELASVWSLADDFERRVAGGLD